MEYDKEKTLSRDEMKDVKGGAAKVGAAQTVESLPVPPPAAGSENLADAANFAARRGKR